MSVHVHPLFLIPVVLRQFSFLLRKEHCRWWFVLRFVWWVFLVFFNEGNIPETF